MACSNGLRLRAVFEACGDGLRLKAVLKPVVMV